VEEDAAGGVEADGEEGGEEGAAGGETGSGRLARGQGVKIDDAEEEGCIRGSGILHANPLLEGAEVVAEVRDASGLDTGEDDLRSWFCGWWCGSGYDGAGARIAVARTIAQTPWRWMQTAESACQTSQLSCLHEVVMQLS